MSVTTIEATFRVTTPMFCGGANGQSAELRAASFKGVLRFWWRACAWSHFNGKLEQIREAEAHLFGSPETGQSKVWVRLDPQGLPDQSGGREVLRPDGAKYLGFGLQALDGSKIRDCLPESFDIGVRLLCRGVDEEAIELLEKAVMALGTLGGMGARSRRGYGSLSLTALRVAGDDRPVPDTPSDLHAAIGGLHAGASRDLPEYTAFSGQSRHLVLQCGETSATEVLNLLGIEYASYRRGERGGSRSEQLKGDYTIATKGKPPGVHPKRIAFGLPLNFGAGKPVEPVEHKRRASPLLFHIHQCGARAVAVVSFLPARYLPEGKSAVTLANGSRRPVNHGEALYQPVADFLDYLAQESEFTPAAEVRR